MKTLISRRDTLVRAISNTIKKAMFINTRLCCLIIFVGSTSVMNNLANAKEIVINIEKINTKKEGDIIVMLFGENGFPKDHTKALFTKVLPATEDSMQIRFNDVPTEFAIKVLHDEDGTGEVTKNWTGFIPAEGLSFSNGAKLSFGPPSFKKAKLHLTQVNKPLKLEMIYP